MIASIDDPWRQRVRRAQVARLATVRPDGDPHLVPVTFALLGEVLATAIDHKPKSTTDVQRLRNISAHPHASVLIDHYHEDWDQLWWVRADGAASIVPAAEAVAAVDALVEKYPPYRRRRPEGPVIVVEVQRWSTWAATAD